MSRSITVLIVDDYALIRSGLRDAIANEEGLTLEGEAASGAEALEMYRKLQPDVVTMDYRMPDEDGLEASRKILAEFPDARIIFLSICEGEEDIWNAWRVGVQGYLSKSESIEAVLEAIHEVGHDGTYFPASIVQKLDVRKQQENLTPRELEILQLLGQGKSNKEIIEHFNISLSTTKHHITSILKKLGAADRTQAVVIAYKIGVLHIDE